MKFNASIVQTRYESPLGSIIIAVSDRGLAGLWFDDQRHLPKELFAPTPGTRDSVRPEPVEGCPPEGAALARGGPSRRVAGPAAWPSDPDHPVLKEVMRQISQYFAGQRTEFEVPLDLAYGTAFQQSVWQALLKIPQGGTASYGEVSQRIGKPAAVRAVGAAVGRNPVSIIVPCHRVMGANGSLTGYAGGLERKSALLKLEGAL